MRCNLALLAMALAATAAADNITVRQTAALGSCAQGLPPLRSEFSVEDQLLLQRVQQPSIARSTCRGTSLKLLLDFGAQSVIWKPLRGSQPGTYDWALSELITYAIDRHLKLYVTPPTMWFSSTLEYIRGVERGVNITQDTAARLCLNNCNPRWPNRMCLRPGHARIMQLHSAKR